jgi:hypothetical protein
MAFDEGLGDNTSIVRFDVGDYNDAAPLISEAIYTATLTRYDDDVRRATVAMAESLIIKVAQDPDKVEVTGAVKVEWSSRIAAWRSLANGLRAELGLAVPGAVSNTLVMGRFTRAGDATTDEYGG